MFFLLERFFSEENVDKIVNKLRENDLDGYAELISRAGGREGLEKFINFKVSPPYVDLHRAVYRRDGAARLDTMVLARLLPGRRKRI